MALIISIIYFKYDDKQEHFNQACEPMLWAGIFNNILIEIHNGRNKDIPLQFTKSLMFKCLYNRLLRPHNTRQITDWLNRRSNSIFIASFWYS